MDYLEAFICAMSDSNLTNNYDRLTGNDITGAVQAIARGGRTYRKMVRSGHIDAEIKKFDEFFHEYIWSRIPPENIVNTLENPN